jgi:hypothetical protein
VNQSEAVQGFEQVLGEANKTLLALLPRLVVMLVLPATQRLARTVSLSFLAVFCNPAPGAQPLILRDAGMA